jgi:hypothetical protein
VKENKETKVRDEEGKGVLGRLTKRTETKETGSSKENDYEKGSLELPVSLELRF